MIQSSAYRASYSISSYVFFCNYDSFYPKESIDSFAFPHRVGITTVVVALKLLRTMEDAYRERERERKREITFENVITKVSNDKDDCFGCKLWYDTEQKIPSFSRSRFLRVFYDFRLQASPANRFAFQVTTSGCLLCRERYNIGHCWRKP